MRFSRDGVLFAAKVGMGIALVSMGVLLAFQAMQAGDVLGALGLGSSWSATQVHVDYNAYDELSVSGSDHFLSAFVPLRVLYSLAFLAGGIRLLRSQKVKVTA